MSSTTMAAVHVEDSSSSGTIDKSSMKQARDWASRYANSKAVLAQIMPAAVGSLLEWYEYAAYGYVAEDISQNFFLGHGGSLSTWAGYAVTFAFRPLGGLVFGWIGDRCGRKLSLQITLVGMLFATVLQGCLPTYRCCGEGWGTFGMVVLLVCRALQGLSAGGELGTAAVYISETSPPEQLGLSTQWIAFSGAFGGFALAAAVVSVLDSIFTPAQMMSFGWRIPFLLSAVFGSLMICYRQSLTETAEFENLMAALAEVDAAEVQARAEEGSAREVADRATKLSRTQPLKELLADFKLAMFLGCVGTAAIGAYWYIVPVYSVTFLQDNAGLSAADATSASLVAYLVTMLFCPAVGLLIDCIGEGKVHLLGVLLTSVAAPLPLFYWWAHTDASEAKMAAYLGMVIVGILQALTASIYAYLVAFFPVRLRCSGVSIVYNLGIGIFGGAGPLIADAASKALPATGTVSAPALYTFVIGLISLVAVLATRRAAHSGVLRVDYVRSSPY
jgi:MHS family proline/betaine transporter-like MFS transporter